MCVGWEFYNVETIAPDYPEVNWIWVDNATSAPVSNVLNITYAQNEGSFLAGYIAAAVSETGVVGAVGGEDADTINDFIVGYTQGAEYYGTENRQGDQRGEELLQHLRRSRQVGKDCAIALNDQGADVIFQIASACGDGVFEAAKEKGFYAIGVDSDQKYIDPEVIICSMKKEVGSSIYDAVKSYLAGDSRFGTTWTADMATGYCRHRLRRQRHDAAGPPTRSRPPSRSWPRRSPPARSSWRRRARNFMRFPLRRGKSRARFLYSKESEVTSLAGKMQSNSAISPWSSPACSPTTTYRSTSERARSLPSSARTARARPR